MNRLLFASIVVGLALIFGMLGGYFGSYVRQGPPGPVGPRGLQGNLGPQGLIGPAGRQEQMEMQKACWTFTLPNASSNGDVICLKDRAS